MLYGREHVELIRRELGVEPPEELTELVEALGAAPTGHEPEWTRPAVPKTPRLPVATPRVGRVKSSRRGRRRWWTVGLPVGLVAVGTALWLATRDSVEPAGEPASAVEEPERLVVLPLDVLTPDEDLEVWGQLAAELITDAIDRAGPIIVVPVERVRQAMWSLGTSTSADSVAGRLRASHAMAGAVARTGDEIRFQVELVDVATGERLAGVEPVVGAPDSVEAVVGRLVHAATAAAVVRLDPDVAAWGEEGDLYEALPVRPEAYRDYVRAVELGCELKLAEAIDVAEQALEKDRDYLRGRQVLAVLHGVAQHYRVADSIFSSLVPLRDRMTSMERAGHDYWTAYLRGDARGTLRAMEEYYRIAPNPGCTLIPLSRECGAIRPGRPSWRPGEARLRQVHL